MHHFNILVNFDVVDAVLQRIQQFLVFDLNLLRSAATFYSTHCRLGDQPKYWSLLY